jgi:hypothetical protein
MPLTITPDWSLGPMGPGFFIKFPRNRVTWHDGGPMEGWLDGDLERKDDEIDTEVAALLMLLRCRC